MFLNVRSSVLWGNQIGQGEFTASLYRSYLQATPAFRIQTKLASSALKVLKSRVLQAECGSRIRQVFSSVELQRSEIERRASALLFWQNVLRVFVTVRAFTEMKAVRLLGSSPLATERHWSKRQNSIADLCRGKRHGEKLSCWLLQYKWLAF